MKLKKILLPIFISVALLTASFVVAMSGMVNQYKKGETNKQFVNNETVSSLTSEKDLTTTFNENLFKINVYDNLFYTGEEQTLIKITPYYGNVYYRVVSGQYNASYLINSSNYTQFESSDEMVTVTATGIGIYTMYYYIPQTTNANTGEVYEEISSSATVVIKAVPGQVEENLFEIETYDDLTYNGNSQVLMTIAPYCGEVYYRVESGSYDESKILNSSNYTDYPSSAEKVTISRTEAGIYTVYYYIPMVEDPDTGVVYADVSSSSTSTIRQIKESLFEITYYDNLKYTGSEQTILTIAPSEGAVYYRVEKGEFNEAYQLTSSNYSSYPSGTGSVSITKTEGGKYTVYYYIPQVKSSDGVSTYKEVSSSATVSIQSEADNLFEISVHDNLTYTGNEQTIAVLKAYQGTVYYRVEQGEHNFLYEVNESNYTNYTGYSGTTEVKQTNPGRYTIYYYVPEFESEDGSILYTSVMASASMTIHPGKISGNIVLSGINADGETVYAGIDGLTSGATLSYQWYYNSEKSITGGRIPQSANSTQSEFTIDDDGIGNYLYVEITATKANYETRTWTKLLDSGISGLDFDEIGVRFEVTMAEGPNSTGIKVTATRPYDEKVLNVYYDGETNIPTKSVTLSNYWDYCAIYVESDGTEGVVIDFTAVDTSKSYYIAECTNGAYEKESLSDGGVNSWEYGWGIYDSSGITVTSIEMFTIEAEADVGVSSAQVKGSFYADTYSSDPQLEILGAGVTFKAELEEGYTFDGWYDGEAKVSSDITYVYCDEDISYGNEPQGLNRNITLQARVSISGYQIVFNSKGGTGTMARQIFEYAERKVLSSNAFSKEGFEFIGWTTVDYDLTTVPAVQFTDCQAVEKLTDVQGATITLYAIWVGQYYTAHVYVMGVGGDYDEGYLTQTMDSPGGSTVTLTTEANKLDAMTTGMALDYATDINGNRITSATISNDNSTIIKFYVKRNTYTLSFNTNGGTSVASKQMYYQQAFGTLPTSTKIGYTLTGWQTEGGTRVNESTTMGSSNITIYAIWQGNTYTVTFNANGGSVSQETKSVIFGSNYGVLPIPTRLAYRFDGWFLSGTEINSLSEVTTASNHTLIASWTRIELELTISANTDKIAYAVSQALFTATSNIEEVTYQWHRSTSNGFTPTASTAISGATNKTYTHTPDLTSKGTYYYVCVATVADQTKKSNQLTLVVTGSENMFELVMEQGLIYDGLEHTLVEVIDSDGIDNNVYYSVGTKLTSSNYTNTTISSKTAPKRTNAGTYEVYFYVPESTNYNELTGHITVVIERNQNLFELIVAQNLVYNGTQQTLLEIRDIDGIENQYYSIGIEITKDNYTNTNVASTGLPKTANAGDHIVYFYVPQTTNYYEIKGCVTVSIAQVPNTFEINVGQNLVYNGQYQQLVEIIDNDGINNNVHYSIGTELNEDNFTDYSTDVPTAKQDGTYVVYFYVPASINYKVLSGFAEVTIDKKQTTLTIDPNGGSWGGQTTPTEYTRNNGETLIIENAVLAGYTFNGWEFSAEALFEEGVYTFDVNDVTMTAIWLSIPPTVSITTDKTSIIYGVEQATLTATAEHELPLTYQWYRSSTAEFTPNANTLISGATSTTYIHTSTETGAGTYYYKCVATTSDGQSGVSNSLGIAVTKATNTVEIYQNNDLVYNGQEQILLQVVDSDDIDNNVYYKVGTQLTASNYESGSTELPTGINAGDYKVYYYIPESNNYSSVSGSATVTIEKADNLFVVNTSKGLVYDGTEQVLAVVTDNDGIDNNIYYSIGTELNKNNYTNTTIASTGVPKAKNSGEHSVYFYIPESPNYKEVSGYVKVEIGYVRTTLTIDPNGGVWEGITEPTSFTENNGTTKNIPDPTRAGYKFIDWTFSAQAMFENKVYTYDLNNVTMTANWEQLPPTVEISCNTESIVYNVDQAIFTAVAEHELTITYQWHRSEDSVFEPNSETRISGATATTYIHTSTETPVGSYYYMCVVTANGMSANSDIIRLDVEKADNILTINAAQGLVYDGTEHKLVEATDIDGIDNNIYYSIGTELTKNNYTDTTISSTTAPIRTDAGEYNVYIYVPESTNFKECVALMIVEIAKIDNTCQVRAIDGLVYDGNAHQLVEVTDSDGSDNNIYYSIGTEINKNNYTNTNISSKEVATATDAGKYQVYVYIPASTNYNECSVATMVEIKKATNEYQVNVSEDLLYTGEAQVLAEVIDSDGIDNNVYYSIGTELNKNNYTNSSIASKELPTGTEAQTYNVYFYIPESKNYFEVAGNVEVEIEVRYTTLTIDPNGGIWNGSTDPVEYERGNGTTITIEVEPTRDGYVFDSWEFSGGGIWEEATNKFTFDVDDATLTAKWKGEGYEITIYTDLADTTTTIEYETIGEAQDITIEQPTLTGYTFDGWEIITNSSFAESSIEGNVLTIPANAYGNIEIKSKWTAETYSIKWIGDQPTGSFLANAEYWNYAGTSGYTTTNTGYNDKYSFDNKMATSAITYDSAISYYTPIPVVSGYTFVGWYDTKGDLVADATGNFVENCEYLDAEGNWITDLGEVDAIIELYAQYSKNTYNITYNYDGGTATNPATYNITNEQTINIPTRDGYTFAGWTVEIELNNRLAGTISSTGIKEVSNDAYHYNMPFYIKSGVEYSGVSNEINWNKYSTDGAFVQTIAGTQTTAGTNHYVIISCNNSTLGETTKVTFNIGATRFTTGQYTLSGNLNVIANWTANTYEVSYDGNGATSGEMLNSTFTYDVEAQLKANTYAKTGYNFGGWATSAEGSAVYEDQETVKNLATSGVFELFAVWTPAEITVTFDSKGGSDVASKTVIYNSAYGELEAPTRTGYTFENWYLDEAFTQMINAESIVTTPNAHILYANWEVDEQKVTLDYQGGTNNFLYSGNLSTTAISGTFEFNENMPSIVGNANITKITDGSKSFNGNSSLRFSGTTLDLDVGNVVGTYKLSAYVIADRNSTINITLQETKELDAIAEATFNLEANIWTYVTINFEITSAYPWVDLKITGTDDTIYHIDDIKVMRTDAYAPTTSIDYTVETPTTSLPSAVKAGYEFLGWNTSADGTGMYVTTYGGGEVGSKAYYAIYKLSNPTATTTANNLTVTYATTESTLTAVVNTEEVIVDSTTYQWYIATSTDFSDEQAITGATNRTYVHTSTSKDVGTYYYRCKVTTTKGTETSKLMTSTSTQIIIEKADNQLAISMEDYTYAGEISIPSVTKNASGEAVTFYYNTTAVASDGNVWTNMTSTTLDAGTYYMYATTPANKNYEAGISDVVEFKVNLAEIEIDYMADSNADLEVSGYQITYNAPYDNDGLTFKLGSRNVDVTIAYWKKGETDNVTETNSAMGSQVTFPTLANAGTITYDFTITANNYQTINGSVTLIVGVETVAVEWKFAEKYIYNGTDQSSAIRAYINGVGGAEIDCELTFTGQSNVFKDAGTYTVTATLDNANYVLTNTSKQVEINKFDVTITANNASMNYGGAKPTYSYQATQTTPDSYQVSYKIYKAVTTATQTELTEVTGTESTLDAGTYIIKPSSTLSTNNYNITYKDGTLTINAQTLTKPSVVGTYTYNLTQQTVQLENFDENTMEIVQGNKATDAGTYTVEIALKDSHNYTWKDGTIDNVLLDWTIAPYDLANANIADIPEQPFTGDAVEPTPEVTALGVTLVAGTHFTYEYNNNINASTEAELTIKAVEGSNYTGTKSTKFTIAGAFISLPTIAQSQLTYNADIQTVQINGFNEETMEIVSGNSGQNVGEYTLVIALKNKTNYTWITGSKDDISLTWNIVKADIELSVETANVIVRVGETATNVVTVTPEYKGSIDGQSLTISGGVNNANITISSVIENNKSTITINPKTGATNLTITITYAGDANHNGATATFRLDIPSIYVNMVIASGSGSATLSGAIEGSTEEVALNSKVKFKAIPSTNYGLMKYTLAVGDKELETNYIETTGTGGLHSVFESPEITITKELVGLEEGSLDEGMLTIHLYFDKIITIDVVVKESSTGALTPTVTTTVESNNVAHIHDKENQKLTVFESSDIALNVKANKVEGQHYVVNEVVVGETASVKNAITTDISTSASALGDAGTITIKPAKVYNADTRTIEDESAVNVATVSVALNNPEDINNYVEISGSKYYVEDTKVNITITKTKNNYDFLGVKIGGEVKRTSQLNASDWTFGTTTNIWNNQGFDKDLSTFEPLIVERWYEVGSDTTDVSVTTDSRITAQLVNTDIKSSYILANNIFGAGDEPLYVGEYKIEVLSATITEYSVVVKLYKNGSATPEEKTYGKDEIFIVDSSVTKVEIIISSL